MIIDIEGTDGCGKKTQTDLLFDFLTNKGYKVKKISFPSYESESSALVKMYLRGEFGENANDVNAYQSSALFAVDRFATMSKIRVEDYDYVLFDRYVPSNMIHQSTKIQDKKCLDEFLDWIEDFEYNKLKLPKPDKILFLDVPVEISIKLARQRANLKNGEQKDIHEKDDDHLINAYNKAKYISNKFNWTTVDCVANNNIKTIDEIHKDILTKLCLKWYNVPRKTEKEILWKLQEENY